MPGENQNSRAKRISTCKHPPIAGDCFQLFPLIDCTQFQKRIFRQRRVQALIDDRPCLRRRAGMCGDKKKLKARLTTPAVFRTDIEFTIKQQ
jgi:hypothetical protein